MRGGRRGGKWLDLETDRPGFEPRAGHTGVDLLVGISASVTWGACEHSWSAHTFPAQGARVAGEDSATFPPARFRALRRPRSRLPWGLFAGQSCGFPARLRDEKTAVQRAVFMEHLLCATLCLKACGRWQ